MLEDLAGEGRTGRWVGKTAGDGVDGDGGDGYRPPGDESLHARKHHRWHGQHAEAEIERGRVAEIAVVSAIEEAEACAKDEQGGGQHHPDRPRRSARSMSYRTHPPNAMHPECHASTADSVS